MSTVIQSEEKVFYAALELPLPAQRRAFLDEACAGDVRLRQRVEQLLAAGEVLRARIGGRLGRAVALFSRGLLQPNPEIAFRLARLRIAIEVCRIEKVELLRTVQEVGERRLPGIVTFGLGGGGRRGSAPGRAR